MVDQEGYGRYLIAKMLNEKGIKTNKGKVWASISTSVVLRNPMYIEYTIYGRGTDKEVVSRKRNTELVIIDEAKWARVQAIREKRNPENTKKKGIECVLRNTKGSLLLVGMARCGHCGNPLTTTWSTKKYTRKDGTEIVKREAKYRCSGKALQKVKCGGKKIHFSICLEGIVLDEIYASLDQLETVDLKEQIEQIKSRNSGDEEKALRKHQKLTDKAKMELSRLKDEVLKVIMWKSPLDREMVNEMVKKKESEVSLLLAKLEMFE